MDCFESEVNFVMLQGRTRSGIPGVLGPPKTANAHVTGVEDALAATERDSDHDHRARSHNAFRLVCESKAIQNGVAYSAPCRPADYCVRAVDVRCECSTFNIWDEHESNFKLNISGGRRVSAKNI